ncbi:MAG: ABC transporter ATP-binding protein [Symploca sp. SIO1C2]|nr:ABC transporter ATP-binding protein [Symploca sp. SIO1C2]
MNDLANSGTKKSLLNKYQSFVNGWSVLLTHPPSKPLPDSIESSKSLILQILSMRLGVKNLLLILGVLYSLLGLMVPIAHKIAVDNLSQGIGKPMVTLELFILGFVALAANKTIALVISMICQRESFVVEDWLSRSLYKKGLTLRGEYQGEKSVGEVVSLMGSHLETITIFIKDLFPAFFTSFIPIVIVPFVLKGYFAIEAWPVFTVVVFSLIVSVFMAKRCSILFQEFILLYEKRDGIINEWIQNNLSLRTLGWSESFEDKIEDLTREIIHQRSKVVSWSSWMNNFTGTMPMFLNIIAILTVLYIHENSLTSGDVLGILWVLGIFLVIPMRTLPWVFVMYFDASVSIDRIREYLSLPSHNTTPDNHASKTQDEKSGSLSLKVQGLTLHINGQTLLDNIDLNIQEGEFVAVIGDVGSGKTLLMESLRGETNAKYKSYYIGDLNVETIPPSQLRAYFSTIPQEPFSFAATVRENIALSYNSNPSEDELHKVKSALQFANLNKDLAAFPDHMNTPIGERGVNLSGGQKQRLELARAHFHNRPIIILDDPLSALDTNTEKAIVDKLLTKAWSDKTRIMVTHRLSFLDSIDRILIVKAGRIVAEGTTESLTNHPELQNLIHLEESESNE